MKPVREVISRDIIDDLWGAGYTILPRRRHPDPFHVPPEMVPQGRSYQWWHLVHDKVHFEGRGGHTLGWAAVPASRHDGYFMPAGHVGDIEVNGLGLFEKSKFEVEQERAQTANAAQQAVHDWKQVTGTMFSGEVSVGGEKTAISETKTYENTTAIPRDMVPYIDKIFIERDRLAKSAVSCMECGTGDSEVDAAVEAYRHEIECNQNLARWPALHALVLPLAIENVRKQIKEAASGEAS